MITSSRIAWGDQLGAQLTKIAQLLYVAEKNSQELVLWEELKDYRRRYQFFEVFELPSFIKIISHSTSRKKAVIRKYCKRYHTNLGGWKSYMNRIYGSKFYKYLDRLFYEWIRLDYKDFIQLKDLKDDVHTDKNLLNLNKSLNYDLVDGFGTYKDWKEIVRTLRENWVFKDCVSKEGERILSSFHTTSKKLVSVHFRRTDYILLSSLNLSVDYYVKALSCFKEEDYQLMVFSDDIAYCKTLELLNRPDTIFVEGNTAGVDLWLMTRCDANIIANSSFSFWGALLNVNEGAKVVCPHDFVGPQAKEASYMNGNYYPEEWIAI